MAITFINESNSNNGSSNSLTPTEPVSTAQNDLVIAHASIAATGGTWTDPADFTEIDQRNAGLPVQNFSVYLGYKVRGSGAGSGYNFSSSSAASQMRVSLITLRGIDTSTPIDVTFVAANHFTEYNGDITSAAKAITTNTAGAWVLLLQTMNGAVAGLSLLEPSGYTQRQQVMQASRSILICSKEIVAAGTETPGVFTSTGTPGTANDTTIYTIAIRPAATQSNAPRARFYDMLRTA